MGLDPGVSPVFASPHEDAILLIHRQFFGVDEFVLHILQVVVV